MRALYVRELTEGEREALGRGLRAPSAFTVRRCQIVLTSADERVKPQEIARRLRCSDQCVREAIHAFEEEGLASVEKKSSARHDMQASLDAAGVERLKELVKLSPRTLGYETSLWTLDLLAQQCLSEGLTGRAVSGETISRTLRRAGIAWRRAKQWIRSPDAQYAVKKSAVTGCGPEPENTRSG